MNRLAKSTSLITALIVVTAALLLGGSQRPASGQGAGRPRPGATATPQPSPAGAKRLTGPRRRSDGGAVARERARAEAERRRREAAEAEAERARAALARAERESSRKKDVWLVAKVANKTKGPIPYQILRNGSWESFTLDPGFHRVHLALNDTIIIKYDYKYESGYQEKRYRLQTTPFVGREPTGEEKEKSKVSSFTLDAKGDIELYHQP